MARQSRTPAIIAFTCCVLSQAAQREPLPAPPSTIKVGTRLVQIDVLVRDKNGPVANLTGDDFTILDQGRPQQIAVFSSAAAQAAASLTTATSLPPGTISNRQSPSGRPTPGATAILLDLVNTQFDHQAYARSQLLKYLESPRPHEQTAIYALGKSLRVVQDFTDDPDKLIQAVRRFDPKLNELIIPSLEHMDDIDIQMYGMSEGFYAERRAQTTEQAIGKIAQHLSGMSGRRSLIWMSDTPGFNGMQYLFAANINLYPVQVRTVGAVRINPWTSANAPMWDAKNVVGQMRANELELAHRNQMVAASRGGVAFADARDIGRAVDQAIEDATHTYTLGFYPSEESLDGKFHTLTVGVIPKLKSLELRYRPGYFATVNPPPAPPAASVHAAFDNPLNSTSIGLTAKSAPDGPGASRVDVTVDLHDLRFDLENGRHVGQVEINYLLDGASTLHTETVKIQLTDTELAGALKDGLLIRNSFDTEGPDPAVRIVVRDPSTGALGSLRVPLSNPQK